MFSRISFLFLVCLLSISIGVVEHAEADTEANKALLLRGLDEVWNQRNAEALVESLHPDAVWHRPGGSPDVIGLDASIEQALLTYEIFPEFQLSVEDIVAEGDTIAVRFIATGIFGPTGASFEYTLMLFYHFVDGKVAELWQVADDLGFQQQVGLLPAPEPPADGDDTTPDSPATTAAELPQSLTEDPAANTAKAIRLLDEIWNAQNADAAAELVHPDIYWHRPAWTGDLIGIEAFTEFARGIYEVIPDFQLTIEDTVAEGDIVAARWTFAGTFAPTGLPYEVPAIQFYRFVDGKIAEVWSDQDDLSFQIQIGLLTLEEPTAEPE
ncbi:MAG: ester cyclase family protein, partial [Candidatus Poribacteria bacterium]|nr:ester cyclase family protein [Candidatus Poribacteria bacterium]